MIPGTGTLVNAAAIIVGTVIGILFRKGLSEKLKTNLQNAIFISVIIMGIAGALANCIKVTENGIETTDLLLMVISLAIGTVIGELCKIDVGFEKIGKALGNKFAGHGDGDTFVKGFVSASVIFCVGAMAIVGSIEDGMAGNPHMLYIKALLDGVTSMILATTLGLGVAFSALAIIIYQGAITLLAVVAGSFIPADVISQMSLVGNVLIMCIGFTTLDIKKINVANMLPSIFIPAVYALIKNIIL
ncbi:MAG: DUF554 domain-containing protein [Clostridia bacterium]|nr:DUF554 domain-containing protein [Clostridia bacterium]